MATYSIIGKGSVGPAHPLYDPRVTVYVDGIAAHVAESAKEGHLWALERGHALPADHHLHESPAYQALLATIRYRESGL